MIRLLSQLLCAIGIFLFINSSLSAQNKNPFLLELNLGTSQLDQSDYSSGIQPTIGFSYLPNRLGFGLEIGLLDYADDTDTYIQGLEDFSTVSGNTNWSTFFLSAGPRVELFSALPIKVRGALDLSVMQSRAPQSQVLFTDPTGVLQDIQLRTVASTDGVEDWAMALRPELQFALPLGNALELNFSTGLHYRLNESNITYSQKDLSDVQFSANARETYIAVETAPTVERVIAAPQNMLFANVGISFRFGGSSNTGLHKEGIIHRDIASRAKSSDANGPCPDNQPFLCPDGSCVTNASFCAPVNATPNTILSSGFIEPIEQKESEDEQQEESNSYKLRPVSSCVSLSTMQIGSNAQKGMRSGAQNHNSSRSNRTSTVNRNEDFGGGTDSTNGENRAQNHNSSRSNRTDYKPRNGGSGGSNDSSSVGNRAQNHNSSRSNRTDYTPRNSGSGGSNDSSSVGNRAQNHNSSRSNRTDYTPRNSGSGGSSDSSGVGNRAQNHNSSRSNRTDYTPRNVGSGGSSDSSGVGNRAQNHNSSRSNRTTSLVYDGDTDGFPDAFKDAQIQFEHDNDSDEDGYGDMTPTNIMLNLGDMVRNKFNRTINSIQYHIIKGNSREGNPLHVESGKGENVLYEGENVSNSDGTIQSWTYVLEPANWQGDDDGDGFGDTMVQAEMKVTYFNGKVDVELYLPQHSNVSLFERAKMWLR